MDEGDWDPTKRREQRRDLRHIIQDTHEHREEITLAGDLLRRLRKIDNVYKDVVSTREAAIDAEGFQLLSSIGKKQVESSVGELVFDPVVFAEKLVTFMGGRRGGSSAAPRDLNWAKLGEKAEHLFSTPPHLTFLHGALDVQPLVKKERQKARKTTASEAAVSKPKELTAFEEEEESTTKDVAHIFEHLKIACNKTNNRVHYFKFLFDPNSFAHTVENLFHFSFLVKDGRAGILIDPSDWQPYIHLPDTDLKSDKPKKSQAMMSLNKSQWEKAIQKYSIVSTEIPPRDD